MPFATLHHSTVDTIDPALTQSGMRGKSYSTPEFSLHWAYGPNEIVQFGVKIDAKVILETARLIQEGNYGIDPGMIDFYTDKVDRAECNNSIKSLRRARDATYGADA